MSVAWVVVLFIVYIPGLMSGDSLGQYEEGMSGHYSETFPPFVSWLFGVAGRVFGSPWPVLLIQLLAFTGGMVALLWRVHPAHRIGALLLLGTFLLLPSNWSIGITLWKDTLMAAGLLLAVAAIAFKRPVLAVVCLAVACMSRYNAMFAAVPLAFAAMGVVRSRWLQLGLTVAVLGAIAALPKALDLALRPARVCMSCPVPAHDLAGIYVEKPELLESSVLASELSLEDLRRDYLPLNVIPLFFDVGQGGRHLNFYTLTPRRDAILSEWLRVVRAHPMLYARNRWRMFVGLLGLDLKPVYYPYHIGIDPNAMGLRVKDHTLLYRGLRQVQEKVRDSLVFRGWFWLALLVSLGGASLAIRRRASLEFWVATSAVLYLASFLVSSLACDFRYHYWSIVATFAAAASYLHVPSQSESKCAAQQPAPPGAA